MNNDLVLHRPARISGLPSEVADMVEGLASALASHSKVNREATAYYEVAKTLRRLTKVVPPEYYELGLCLGWVGKAVDLLVRRCRLDDISVPGVNLKDTAWPQLSRMYRQEVKSAITESLITGVSWLLVSGTTPSERAKGAPIALLEAVTGLDGTGAYNPRTRHLDSFLRVHERAGLGEITDFSLYVAAGVLYQGGFMIRYRQTVNAEGETVWDLAESAPISAVPVIPVIYKPRAGKPFGQSRITNAMMSAQDMGVRSLIRGEGHMDVYSFPQMIFKGAEDSLFKNPDGTIITAWQVMLGRIKAIPDNPDMPDNSPRGRVDIDYIPSASPEPHLKWVNLAAKLFCREAELPDTALAVSGMANPTSAESYDSSQYELIAAAEGATDDWSDAVAEAARLLLVTAGESAEDWQVLPVWHSPRFLTKSAVADAGLKTIAAVPWLADTEVGLEIIGLDPTQIQRALAERAAAKAALQQEALTLALAGGSPLPSWPPTTVEVVENDGG